MYPFQIGPFQWIAAQIEEIGAGADLKIFPIAPAHRMRQMLDNTAWGARTKQTHLTRLGAPEDIAASAAFLASREATFITGAQLLVDGGARLGGERLIGSIGS